MLTSTHKDRLAFSHILNALANGYDTITCGTCGNYGVALATFSSYYGLKTIIFVPKSYFNARINEMKKYNAEVILIDGSYEEAVAYSVQYARENSIYDANPGSINSHVGINAFRYIAFEIFSELNREPNVISIPVGNGTTLAGIYNGFLELYKKGLIEKIPIFIGGTTLGGNQIYLSWKNRSPELIYMDKTDIKETWINEPLVSYEALDGSEALNVIYATGGAVYAFSDKELLKMRKRLRTCERLTALPASTASILASKKFVQETNFKGIFVALITGGEKYEKSNNSRR